MAQNSGSVLCSFPNPEKMVMFFIPLKQKSLSPNGNKLSNHSINDQAIASLFFKAFISSLTLVLTTFA